MVALADLTLASGGILTAWGIKAKVIRCSGNFNEEESPMANEKENEVKKDEETIKPWKEQTTNSPRMK